jgi:hypothetical protein
MYSTPDTLSPTKKLHYNNLHTTIPVHENYNIEIIVHYTGRKDQCLKRGIFSLLHRFFIGCHKRDILLMDHGHLIFKTEKQIFWCG